MIRALRHRLHTRRAFAALWLLLCVLGATSLSASPLPAHTHTAQSHHHVSASANHGHHCHSSTAESSRSCCADSGACCHHGGMTCSCAAACGVTALPPAPGMVVVVRSLNDAHPAVASPSIPGRQHGPPLRPPAV